MIQTSAKMNCDRGSITTLFASRQYLGAMTEKINRNHTFISAGTKVKLSNSEEYGIVVHSWYDKEMDCVDCYVAFFGNSFPDNQTKCKPYILRYLVTSLETVE